MALHTPLAESRLPELNGSLARSENRLPLRIVIAEDQQMFREVLRRVCVREFNHDIVGEAQDGVTAVRIVTEERPHVLLLDIGLPKLDGFAVARAVRQTSPSTLIIAVTAAHHAFTIFRIEREGFDGYIDKGSNSLSTIRAAVDAVTRGQRYYSALFVAERTARLRDPCSFDKVLSDREIEVLSLIGLGLNNEEISVKLGICSRTAETFRHHILRKLKVPGTPKLIRLAIDLGFSPNS